jgi:membrane protease YdiL (CAAX protease family)
MIGARDRTIRREQLRPIAPANVRPFLVMAMGVIFAASSGKIGPVVFAGVLALGLVVLWFGVRRGKQHIRAIYASAALFGLVHWSVWPSPIPLFALGLGLGWIAVRSRGVLVPIIVHGLFNAVSAVYVLRGAT